MDTTKIIERGKQAEQELYEGVIEALIQNLYSKIRDAELTIERCKKELDMIAEGDEVEIRDIVNGNTTKFPFPSF